MNQWQYLCQNEGDRVERKLVDHIRNEYGQRAGDVRKWSKLDCKYGADVIWEYREKQLVNIQVKLSWETLVNIDNDKRRKYKKYVDVIVVFGGGIKDYDERERMEKEMNVVIVTVAELDQIYLNEEELKLKRKPADMHRAMWAVIHNS